MAKEAIRRGECHIAIAGGVNLGELKERDYTYTPNHILSPDGHCRALDSSANGTVPAQGLGVVVLKPLVAAQQDHDQIYAVIIGSAINNDGSNKASYAAPNPLGQKKVIQKALADCQQPEVKKSMYYIECHGTGTQLGDMIELTALGDVYSNEKIQRPIAIGILIHPSHGDVSQYQALAVHLHSDQIVMAFRAPSLDGVTMPHSSLVDIGKDYLTTLMHEKIHQNGLIKNEVFLDTKIQAESFGECIELE
ncbi:unnamed protein product [Rotaria sordida]|uniref:Ketosynthase family 3 (KS3) domain-containing protein n=1 Tax=Rotaria sordida TaxID=392033 RepID=A0A814GLA7_9BILA|nr:unnamed protein product [Rotaria sordida]CAF1100939.1 unnamed protein product [Rotaria sordida]